MSQTLFGLGEEQRNETFTWLLQDNNAKCCLSHRALAAWRAISARREPGTSQQREPFVRTVRRSKLLPAMAAAVTSRICEMGRRARMSLSNKTALAMIFKLAEAAERSWRRLNGHNQLPKIILGIKFSDGIEVVRSQAQTAAA